MTYSNVALKDKIMAMYPEITKHKISVGLDFIEDMDAYVINFRKNSHELLTYLDKNDADECMQNVKCVHLGVKVGEFVRNFEAGE